MPISTEVMVTYIQPVPYSKVRQPSRNVYLLKNWDQIFQIRKSGHL